METVAMGRVEGVYREVHPRLWRALVAYCGDQQIAQDAESEAFAQLLRRGDAVADLGAWVWRAAFRIAAGMLADRRADERRPLPAAAAELPASTVEFLDLLRSLSAQQRACVVLRYLGSLTPTEIAEVLETTPGTVRVQLHRSHGILRRGLGAPAASEVSDDH